MTPHRGGGAPDLLTPRAYDCLGILPLTPMKSILELDIFTSISSHYLRHIKVSGKYKRWKPHWDVVSTI